MVLDSDWNILFVNPTTEHFFNRTADELIGNASKQNGDFCFAKAGEVYVVYLATGAARELDLRGTKNRFELWWFNPRLGGTLARGKVRSVAGGAMAALGEPPSGAGEDWVVLLKRR